LTYLLILFSLERRIPSTAIFADVRVLKIKPRWMCTVLKKLRQTGKTKDVALREISSAKPLFEENRLEQPFSL